MLKKTILILSVAFLLMQCKHDTIIPDANTQAQQSAQCDSDTVYFVNDILPLYMSGCATTGCHDNQTAKHGVKMTSYTNIIQTGEIRPGRPNDSKAFEVLTEGGEDRMPPSPQASFTSAQIALIRTWIQQGAKNNECIEDCNLDNVGFAADVSPIINSYCLSCHSGSSPNGGVSLTNYSNISSAANSGVLLNAITGASGAPLMPPSGAMNDCNINKITKWINDGAQNN